ncbi:hypothetical protein V7S43_013352 [Phytophthora oleae]|uniref:FAR1 domain-containing protein n=1 Tax=Phytophthora oleae TaxID=2107226 RepID=A0ABD3F453_9STRA
MTKRRAFYTGDTTTVVWKRGLECDRTGSPKQTQHLRAEDRVRQMRGSKRMGCKMKLVIKAVPIDDPHGPWQVVHTRDGSRLHNHPPSEDARVHASHRQRAAAETTGVTSNKPPSFPTRETADEDIVVLPPISAVVREYDANIPYEGNFLLPRYWGYAGWSV